MMPTPDFDNLPVDGLADFWESQEDVGPLDSYINPNDTDHDLYEGADGTVKRRE